MRDVGVLLVDATIHVVYCSEDVVDLHQNLTNHPLSAGNGVHFRRHGVGIYRATRSFRVVKIVVLGIGVKLVLTFCIGPQVVGAILLVVVIRVTTQRFYSDILHLVEGVGYDVSLHRERVAVGDTNCREVLAAVRFFHRSFAATISLRPTLVPKRIATGISLLTRAVVYAYVGVMVLEVVGLLRIACAKGKLVAL